MENRKPDAPVARPRRRRLPWVLALGCIILVAFVVLQWPARQSAPGTGVEFADSETVEQPPPVAQAPNAQGAMIIDDPAAAEETRTALESLPLADGAEAASDAPRTASTAKSSRTARRRTAQRGTARPAKAAETDLLSTLMRIIKEEPAKEQAAAPASMDELVARIEAEDNRNRSENQAALASLGGDEGTSAPVRSPDVQQQLRACPRANTVSGIECRRKVCARHVGDAACPRQ